jgi:hypothetical protein
MHHLAYPLLLLLPLLFRQLLRHVCHGLALLLALPPLQQPRQQQLLLHPLLLLQQQLLCPSALHPPT